MFNKARSFIFNILFPLLKKLTDYHKSFNVQVRQIMLSPFLINILGSALCWEPLNSINTPDLAVNLATIARAAVI